MVSSSSVPAYNALRDFGTIVARRCHSYQYILISTTQITSLPTNQQVEEPILRSDMKSYRQFSSITTSAIADNFSEDFAIVASKPRLPVKTVIIN